MRAPATTLLSQGGVSSGRDCESRLSDLFLKPCIMTWLKLVRHPERANASPAQRVLFHFSAGSFEMCLSYEQQKLQELSCMSVALHLPNSRTWKTNSLFNNNNKKNLCLEKNKQTYFYTRPKSKQKL